MRILIVDDSEERVKAFASKLQDHYIYVAYDANQAYAAIHQEDRFDYIFLDHDLCGGVYENSDEKSGYGVAKYLVSIPEKYPQRVIIHSLNPSGAKNIEEALKSAGIICNRVPFAWTKINGDSRLTERQ